MIFLKYKNIFNERTKTHKAQLFLFFPKYLEKNFDGFILSFFFLSLGTIDYSEFLAATMERHMYIREEQLYEAFNRFDVDRSGVITLDNLKEVNSFAIDFFFKSLSLRLLLK